MIQRHPVSGLLSVFGYPGVEMSRAQARSQSSSQQSGGAASEVSLVLPPHRRGFSDTYQIEGKPLPPGSDHASVPILFVSHDYFRALGIPLLRGRWFDYQDTATSPRTR